MKITPVEIKIRDIANGYRNEEEEGVVAFGGKLNVRPKYQREFVYDDKKRNAVIDTIKKGFPLNVMYWVDNGDGTFEVLDGQQRTISFCEYISGSFSIDGMAFHNLTNKEKDDILDYEIRVYQCAGNDKEQLDWFKIINIAGEELTTQELRNAVYTGEWLMSAKKYFSKTNCPAYHLGGNYLNGSAIRQDYLETAIKWISNNNIEDYMSAHQNDANANELWLYFQNVINWVQVIYPKYDKKMKGINWGYYFDNYHSNKYDTKKMQNEIDRLMMDDDITNQKGIFEYLIDGDEKHLSIREFTEAQKTVVYNKQKGICAKCGNHFELKEMHGDHIKPWSKGGKTVPENCQMLCARCNATKSNKY